MPPLLQFHEDILSDNAAAIRLTARPPMIFVVRAAADIGVRTPGPLVGPLARG